MCGCVCRKKDIGLKPSFGQGIQLYSPEAEHRYRESLNAFPVLRNPLAKPRGMERAYLAGENSGLWAVSLDDSLALVVAGLHSCALMGMR